MDPDEMHHDACREMIEQEGHPLILSPFVLCELHYLVLRKLGPDAETVLLDDVASGAYELATMGRGEVASARSVAERYRDLSVGLADASVVVLAERHRTIDILTLDERHFRAMQPSKGSSFRLLPADA